MEAAPAPEISELVKAVGALGAVILAAAGTVVTGWLRKPKPEDHVVIAADLADSKPIRDLVAAVTDLARQIERSDERATDDAQDLQHQVKRLIEENRRSADALEYLRRQSDRPPVL